jgi:HAD superfamily hydrolase (TIGR01509 family)
VAGPFELVIFDCDGVLVDSERIAVRVEAEFLAELGWPLSQAEIIERFMGRTAEYMDEAIEARLGGRLPGDWKDQFQRRYREAFAADLQPVDGVVEALDQITVPTCVASSGSHDKLRLTLGHTGLYGRFQGRIFSGYEVANGKPAPDLFLHAAARMGADPAGSAVVEDSRWGVEAARAAGMRAFGYAGGLTPPEYLEGHCTVVFEDMRELPRLLADGAA